MIVAFKYFDSFSLFSGVDLAIFVIDDDRKRNGAAHRKRIGPV